MQGRGEQLFVSVIIVIMQAWKNKKCSLKSKALQMPPYPKYDK